MTEQPIHPISLDTVFFTKSFVQAVPGHDPIKAGAVTVQPENHINVAKMEGQTGTYAATMSSVFNADLDKSTPYYFDMECVAVLRADETLSEEDALRGVTITAHNVLYGAIREAVAWATGRQAYGSLVLGLSVLRPQVISQESTDKPT